MQFNSYGFIFVFLPAAVLTFIFLRSVLKAVFLSRLVLVFFGLLFYGLSNSRFLALLVASLLLNFVLGIVINRCRKLPKGATSLSILVMGTTLNLGVLFYFKYANIMAHWIQSTGIHFKVNEVTFPLALSFYTFQQIAFLIDVSNDRSEKLSFLSYCEFVTFFPYLISGPISRYRDMATQFERPKANEGTSLRVLVGLTIFFIGLFKKVILAEQMTTFSDPVFSAASSGAPLGLLAAWIGALSFSFQLYFDFSGYSDMAIGAAWLFGVQLPLNFNSPYKAKNIIDFWRRWHMTLSSLIMAFVFTPLATILTRFASKHFQSGLPQYLLTIVLPSIATFVIVGAWHGEGLPYIAFGLTHGILFALNYHWRKLNNRAVTFLAAVAAFSIFHSSDLSSASLMIRGLFGFSGIAIHGDLVPKESLLWLALTTSITWFAPNTREILGEYYPALPKERLTPEVWAQNKMRWTPTYRGALISAAITVCAILGLNHGNPFIYFRF